MNFNYKKVIYLLLLTLIVSLFLYKYPVSNSHYDFLVHYIDVGQGDSILIQSNTKNLLIDAGTPESSDNIIKYLKSQKVKKLNFIIATHPHADHIGGMSKIIETFPIDSFYAPKVTHSNESFKSLLTTLKEKKLHINILSPKHDNNIDLGENTKVEVLSPNNESYDNVNNYSPFIKISYGETFFLFTGDGEAESEKEVLETNANIKSHILKIGHHGSSTSSTEAFLDTVDPKIAVISAGLDNSHGHPTHSTLEKLKKRKIKILRTDEDGTIKISSDGKNISLIK